MTEAKQIAQIEINDKTVVMDPFIPIMAALRLMIQQLGSTPREITDRSRYLCWRVG
jgi:hypothetical protein